MAQAGLYAACLPVDCPAWKAYLKPEIYAALILNQLILGPPLTLPCDNALVPWRECNQHMQEPRPKLNRIRWQEY